MTTETKNIPAYDLPHLDKIFEALRRGKHITARDGDIFYALKKNEAAFESLFEALGFRMLHHARDFFYFHDASNFTNLSARIAVFMFIMVEHLADQGEAVEETVMTRRFSYQDMPHLQGDRYSAYMREAGVETPDDLAAVVLTMERFGFARRIDSQTFSFDTPIYRFLDLCMEMAASAAASKPSETAAEEGTD